MAYKARRARRGCRRHLLRMPPGLRRIKGGMIPYPVDVNEGKTMSLSLDDVKRIARLARIAVTDEEVAASQAQLNGLFGLIEEMQSIDTKGIEPMAHVSASQLRLREDAATAPDRRDAFQAVAPAVQDGLYLVPKVIE